MKTTIKNDQEYLVAKAKCLELQRRTKEQMDFLELIEREIQAKNKEHEALLNDCLNYNSLKDLKRNEKKPHNTRNTPK